MVCYDKADRCGDLGLSADLSCHCSLSGRQGEAAGSRPGEGRGIF